MTKAGRNRSGLVDIAVLAEEIARSSRTHVELRALCEVCVRLHGLAPDRGVALLGVAEAIFRDSGQKA